MIKVSFLADQISLKKCRNIQKKSPRKLIVTIGLVIVYAVNLGIYEVLQWHCSKFGIVGF